jgi:cubilin
MLPTTFRFILPSSFRGKDFNFTAEHGSFTSPGYPNEYPLNTECVWTVYSPPGNKIMIAFR